MPTNIRVRVTEEEYDRIKLFADKDRRNLSQFVRTAALEKCDIMEQRYTLLSAGPLFDTLNEAIRTEIEKGGAGTDE